jgi:hypothetical protein
MEIPLWRLDWPRLDRPFCNVYVIAAEGVAMKKAESKRRWNESLAIAERVEAAYSIDATR